MSDYSELKRLAEAAGRIHWHQDGFDVQDDDTEDYCVAHCRSFVEANFVAAANPAVVLALIAENERLRQITRFDEAVACVFDYLKIAAANTSDRQWDDQLEDLAEDVIDYSPEYKRQWKSISSLCAERDQLKADLAELTEKYEAARDRKNSITALKAEVGQLREERDSQQRVCILAMEERDQLKAEIKLLKNQVRGGDIDYDLVRGELAGAQAMLETAQSERDQLKAEAEALRNQVDLLLAHCPDGECATCGEIICPHGGAMHFHHDGCPSCAEHESAMSKEVAS